MASSISDHHGDAHNPPVYANEKKSIHGEEAAQLPDDVASDDVAIAENQFGEVVEVKQGLHQRHIQMIAIAGTIGTGLFLGSGSALANGGPLGILLGYTITGLSAASVVMAVAEMGTLIPLNGGIIRYSELFVEPALSFANGWNSVYSSLVSIPNEIVAAAVLIEFWISINNSVWIVVFGFLTTLTSVFHVRIYGELEFGFSMLKIFLIVFVNIMALVITCGGGPSHQAIGFEYWRNPGPFVQYLGYPGALGQFMGFWKTFTSAVYAYSGIEGITVAAAEVRNPRVAIPQAARRIFWRILLFYVISIFMITLVVPSNNKDISSGSGTASESPFVVAANIAGIKVVPSIINAIVITSAWSAANSGMLGATRTIYGMAKHGHAPKVFLRLNRFGIPYVGVALFAIFICLGFMTLSSSASEVFTWLQDLVAISALVNWSIILITYLRFFYGCKAQGIDRKELPWQSPFQPYFSWLSLFLFILLLLTSGFTTFIKGDWDTETFVSSYFNIPFIIILYFAYKLIMKSRLLPLNEIPIRSYIVIANNDPMEQPKPKRGLQKLNILWS